MTDLVCQACGRPIVAATREVTGGYCRPCHKQLELQAWKAARKAAGNPGPLPVELDEGVITRDLATDLARNLMVEPWFWSVSDDNSPFGNDTGADTVALFAEWRDEHRRASPDAFLRQLFQRWEIDRALDPDIPDSQLQAQLDSRAFHVLTGDDALVATAFAQLAREGKVDDRLLPAAQSALRRQGLPLTIAFRGWTDAAERQHRVARMSEVLDAARPTARQPDP